jgi:hypothetical protein
MIVNGVRGKKSLLRRRVLIEVWSVYKYQNFDGDKSKFASFWAAFSAIVDETSALSKHKMLRLKACLEGKAAEAISKLGCSYEAYEEAKNRYKRS